MIGVESKKDRLPIVIVGSGSTGASTAYQLGKAGCNVLVVDRGQVASGTTSLSMALVRTHYSNELVARMALYSLRTFQQEQQDPGVGFVNSGLIITASDEFMQGIDENLSMLTRIGVNTRVLDKSEVRGYAPELDLEGCDYFVIEPESGYADPTGTTNSYAARARMLGANFILNNGVDRIEISKDRSSTPSTLVLEDGQKIKYSKVILCTNVWTNSILSKSGVKQEDLLPIWVGDERVLVLRRPAQYQGKKPIVWDYPNHSCIKPDGNSLLLASSLDAPADRYYDPRECPQVVPEEYAERLMDAVCKRIPCMYEGSLSRSYVGMYDMTPDNHPIIDELSEIGLPGVYCCAGLSGHGFKLSPAYGLINAEMVLEKSDQTFDREPFSLSRFKSGKTFKGRYSNLATVA